MNQHVLPAAVSPEPTTSTRRTLLTGAAAGLVIGFAWNGRKAMAANEPAPFAPNAFVRIAPDNTVTILIKHLEMGQGVYTGLSTIVAEELDADWAQVRAEHAPADVKLYANTGLGIQMTGGSTSTANSYEQLRKAGATARAMLVAAAAAEWRVPAGEIAVSNGVLSCQNKRATFGELAAKAATMPVPADVTLKDAKDFKLIGRDRLRLDTPEKSDGSAKYALDIMLPGMVVAVVARPPRFGGTVKHVNAEAAKAVRGVREVIAIPSGVAVVADTFWQAHKGRSALQIEWDESIAETRGTAELFAEYKAKAATPGISARKNGDAADAMAKAARTVTAEFEFPYLAHAPMEPLDCVMVRGDEGAEVWAGCQFQTIDQGNVAGVLGLKPEQVKINTVFAGGSFGRRANIPSDYMVEAAHIAKALPLGMPVKLLWTRKDDIRGGRYRPMYYHALKAGLDAGGKPIAWQHMIVGQAILKGTPFEAAAMKNGYDGSSVEGAANLPYDIANIAVDVHTTDVGVPVLWWRSVGNTHNSYATETFVDQIAKAVGQDPVAFRRELLAKHPRHVGVLNLVADKAEWTKPLGPNRARGVAVVESFGTLVAEVVEITGTGDGGFTVDRVICAVDCGVAVNPDIIRTQMEGGIAYGLSAILKNAVTLKDGVVEQSNFDNYGALRMAEMPAVEVHIVPSTSKPSGVGEPGVPPIGPALANAVFALTGKLVTKLPMQASVGV
ncbi:MAG: xanthine dehydrogenase family protein molybdopterin-binding subunit [Rhodospirillaceae bacterium]|nr:xanthine dehydrogenase family protein molybdopterin-binding subunit [Rhodospirillaceae bacterium]